MPSESQAWDHLFEDSTAAQGPADPPSAQDGERDKGLRKDIQGLRAVAVVAVVANHLTGHPQGGFVGVDVFFVISGYLITALLLREGQRRGRISLPWFYARRVRRLLPAALTVTALTILAASLIFNHERLHDTLGDALAATLFVANWHLISTGTDYFQAQHAISPMQHYWSLSVEEQFYVVWPVMLLIIFVVCARFTRAHATAITGTVAALTLSLASLAVAWQQSSDDPVVAYFSTFARGWELGLGALLAVVARWMRGGRPLLTAISWTGLTMIGLSLFFVNGTHFPFPGALLPCLGSALVIAAQSAHATASNVVLTNRLANYVGDISYSVYLVHFPVIIFFEALVIDRSVLFHLGTTAALLGISMVLFHSIEDPIRKSNWLVPRPARIMRMDSLFRPSGVIIGIALAAVALVTFVLKPDSELARYNEVISALDRPTTELHIGPEQEKLAGELDQALRATSWPTISPALDDRQGGVSENAGCVTQAFPPAGDCTWGDPSAHETMYLVGDSTSIAYSDAFIELIKNFPDWKVRVAGGAGCTFGIGKDAAWCPARNQALLDELSRVRPDVLVVTDVSGRQVKVDQTRALVDEVKDEVGTVVMLPAPPVSADPGECYTKQSAPIDCVAQVPGQYRRILAREGDVAAEAGGVLIDPTDWVCTKRYCPVFVGSHPLRRDDEHITPQYAQFIAPVVQESLVAAGVLPKPS